MLLTGLNMLIRAAKLSDLDEMMRLSTQMGEGMTSMPHDEPSWRKKLETAESSFADEPEQRGQEIFQLVLVDENSDRIMGTCAIFAAVGMTHQFYSYKVSRTIMRSVELDITADTEVLHLVNDFTGRTELASLFLQQEFRRNPKYPAAGRFLSSCRYLMLADFRTLFNDHVFAEIRGWINEDGTSPFWDAVGKHFFDIEFTEADFMSAVNGTQFIADLMPKDPVHIKLLSPEAQEVIAKPNKFSEPAMKMLEAEGFYYTHYVDIFDAGPTIQCRLDQIESVRAAQTRTVIAETSASEPNATYLVSNQRLEDYRIVMAEASIESDSIALSAQAQKQLGVMLGDSVTIIPLRHS